MESTTKFLVMLMGIYTLISFTAQANQSIYIQAAACHKQRCVDTYRAYIENLGYPSQVKYTQQTKDRFQVRSRITEDKTAAQAYVALINKDNRVRVTAKLESIEDHVYIDLGEQSNQTQAEWLANFAAHLATAPSIPKNNLSFTIKHQIEQMFAIKILSGPYLTNQKAEEALAKIKTIDAFSRAFIVKN